MNIADAPPEYMQAEQAVHDPVVFFDESGRDRLLVRHDANEVGKLRVAMQIVTGHMPPYSP